MQLLGIRLVGLDAENLVKLLLSIGLVVIVLVARRLLRSLTGAVLHGDRPSHVRFWANQAWSLLAAIVLIAGLGSLWFDNPQRLTTALGLISAGLAVALQKVVTSVAGYFVIMRGRVFTVGDRIVMGGVRGDVIDLTFTQTRIMEMGQPPPVEPQTDPAMWVHARQYTGRIVSVSNALIFDEAVYNYTREFPYIWDEMRVPVSYKADRARAEQILLAAARKHTAELEHLAEEDRAELRRRYPLETPELGPRVFWRMTDNWLELTIRFLAREHGVRALKDAMTRDMIAELDRAGIEIASSTFELVGLPKVEVSLDGARAAAQPQAPAQRHPS